MKSSLYKVFSPMLGNHIHEVESHGKPVNYFNVFVLITSATLIFFNRHKLYVYVYESKISQIPLV